MPAAQVDSLMPGKQIDCWVKYVDEGQGKLGLTMIPRRQGVAALEDLVVGSVSIPSSTRVARLWT